jgi:hypothetical protein
MNSLQIIISYMTCDVECQYIHDEKKYFQTSNLSLSYKRHFRNFFYVLRTHLDTPNTQNQYVTACFGLLLNMSIIKVETLLPSLKETVICKAVIICTQTL